MDTEYIKLIRARTVDIEDGNSASASCQVDLVMPGDGGSGIAAQEYVVTKMVVVNQPSVVVPRCC